MSTPIEQLSSLFPAERIKTDAESLQYYGKDWTTYFDVKALAIVFPISTEDVQSLVKWARANKIALVPSGGRTGLSGAAVATNGEVVVSFEKMNQILEFDPIDSTVRLEPGVIVEDLQHYALEKGRYYPVDFAARGSAHIGGTIATNAGGIKVVRYGVTREWVTSLKVVTGTGDVLELNQSLVKNNTGFDLRHLFIGSEGTLGFIVEATMKLAPPPPELRVLLLAIRDLDAVMKVFSEFRQSCVLSAFEMFSDKALAKVMEGTGLGQPLPSQSPFYVVCEVEAPTEDSETKALGAFERCMNEGWVTDGAMASSIEQAKTFWRYREDISESLAKYSPYKNDIAVRISKVPGFLTALEGLLAKAYPTWEVIWFGHIGDGNLHVNILRPAGMSKEEFVKECRKVDALVFESIQQAHGSISAEHGVGLTKKPFLQFTRSVGEIAMMRGMKQSFDPDSIMNPGKIFD
ncbi:MAG: FAD-binding oxidoreductase [Bdellovibrio sp.]